MRNQSDSAITELNLALDELRKQDQTDLVVFYDSKALAEYSIGVLLEGAGSVDSAREAYGRALQEDLSYYPAHMRLGLLALGKHDTTTAVSELALAAQLATDEPHIRYVNGYVLAAAHRYSESVTELRKAVELEPMYALPYLHLGQVYEVLEKGPESLAAYQAFLAHASRNDPQREFATERVADLKELLAPALTPKGAPALAPAASNPVPVKP
jgi:tetratricopeptide (TPR) repeat protein